MSMTRRDFLKGTAGVAAATGIAGINVLAAEEQQPGSVIVPEAEEKEAWTGDSGDLMTVAEYTQKKWSFEIPPAPIADEEISETKEAEIIIVGAGTAGICTAISAAQAGASVIMFAMGSGPVGRGGSIFAVNSKYMEERGIAPLSPIEMRYELKATGYDVDANKWFKWYRNSEEAMNWFIDLTEQTDLVFRMERGNFGEHKGDPSYCPLGTHTWQDVSATNCADGQPATVAALLKIAQDLGVETYFNTTAKQLVREDDNTGRVTAVIAQDADGNYIKFQGSKAIVLATGDFSRNYEMMHKYAPTAADYFWNYNAEDFDPEKGKVYGGLYQGDGQKMGLWIGAAWQKGFPNAAMVGAFGSQGCRLAYDIPSGFVCDMEGNRFTTEMMTTGLMSKLKPHIKGNAFCHIWDTDYAASGAPWCLSKTWYEQELPTPEETIEKWEGLVESEFIIKGETLEELLEKMGLPVEDTMAQIERYNEMCDAGEDTDFFKPAEELHAIRTGPFYGSVANSLIALTVLGGLRTDINMKVCDADDNPIPGLYNVGTMVGDVFGGSYSFQFAGHNLGMTCVTFGYLTGKYIAENE